jgi:flavin reductase (DIM6/NTAB) family NADH-FMN oxidoreductase RutF
MKNPMGQNFYSIDTSIPFWDRVFTVTPLVVIGTKEDDSYDLAPKHMAIPLGFDNYYGFVCTPKHATYKNIKKTEEFTVSFLLPNQVVMASLSASPRCDDISKSKSIVEALPTIKATMVDALCIAESYLFLECELFKIIDGFNENVIITGKIIAAYIDKNYLKDSERDEQQQLKENPLLAYISYGRFAEISETFHFRKTLSVEWL